MSYEAVYALLVKAWGREVGAVALDPRSGFYAFEYTPSWQRDGVELAPLTMPLRGPLTGPLTGPRAGAVHVFPTLPEATYHRLPAMLADSLPDAFGNAIVNAALAAQGVATEWITPLDRLAYLGSRGVGALEFHPARGPRTRRPTAIQLDELVTAARAVVHGQFVDDRETEAALANLIAVGTSAGGARAKAVIAWNPTTGEIRSGQLAAPEGFEHWLLKLDGVGADAELGTGGGYGRIEYAYHLMARAAGLTVSDSRLLEENGRAHFMTRRFDRVGGERVHVQTLCAMAHLDFNQRATHDYAQYLQTIDRLALGPEARAEGFRRMAFNLWAANRDDHTKNLSFLCTREGHWSLAPAYDITHAHNPDPTRWTAQHQMGVGGHFTAITIDDVAELADRSMVPGWRGIVAQVQSAVDRWPEFAAAAGLDAPTTATVHHDIVTLAPR